MKIAIAGIHTEIGKTITSSILVEALGFGYWKPVQAGDLENSDSLFVRNHTTSQRGTIHPEGYRLSIPASPHWAAEVDGTEIVKEQLILPPSPEGLIVETAGGLMSPLSSELLNIDLLAQIGLPIVLVSNNYLGSINHTLLSYHALKHYGLNILGLVFSGREVESSRSYILQYTGLPLLLSIPHFSTIDRPTLSQFAQAQSKNIKDHLYAAYSKG